jgi:predicted thioesterase
MIKMSKNLTPGDKKIYKKEVLPGDLAAFHNKIIYEVYSTFALARDIEWSSRLFVLDILEEDEEAVGTQLKIKHLKPAFLGQKILIEAVVKKFEDKILDCEITVKCGKRKIATGFTKQKILSKKRLAEIFNYKK